jgi:hypothetical protein
MFYSQISTTLTDENWQHGYNAGYAAMRENEFIRT